MPFIDDDLKRLKEALNERYGGIGVQAFRLFRPELEGLLARLEAAEDLIKSLVYEHEGAYFPAYTENADVSKFKEFKKWKHSKGETTK